MPWQQAAADVALEYDPVSGLLRYGEVDITVPRQSGKTTLTLAKKVHRLTVMAKRLGPQRSTYTAQTRLASRKKLERDFAEALRRSRSFREVPHARARPTKATEWRLTLNNGSEAIQFGSGSFLQIDAPNRTGGHGDTLDDGTIDEAFSQHDDTIEAAMRPSMATRKNAQLWVISTAGDADSSYLWRKVLAGRSAAEAGEHGSVCYIEYSAPDDADPGDPATWWACMPALGITVTEDFISGEWERAQRKGQEGIDTFRRAYLNQWPNKPSLTDGAGGGIDRDVWAASLDADADQGAPVFAVATSPDASFSAIGVAWVRPDGRVQVQVADRRPGQSWVPLRVRDLKARWSSAQVLAGPTSRVLVPDGTHLKASEVVEAYQAFALALDEDRIRHFGEAALNTAVAGASWRVRESGRVLDADPALLAVALAASHIADGSSAAVNNVW